MFFLTVSTVYAQTAVDYNVLGNEAYKKGDLFNALPSYDKAIETDPHYAEAYNNRGLVYVKQGDFDQAIADFSKAIALNPDDAEAYYNRGHLYADHGDLTLADIDCTHAIQINPNYAKAYNFRAVIYYHLEEYDKALADVQKAEELGAVVNLNFIDELMGALKK